MIPSTRTEHAVSQYGQLTAFAQVSTYVRTRSLRLRPSDRAPPLPLLLPISDILIIAAGRSSTMPDGFVRRSRRTAESGRCISRWHRFAAPRAGTNARPQP